MEPNTLPTTFISYSRRQLYFAEAIALHLQQAGIDIWFDLQQLKAGQVWADGLKQGIGNASTLVLVVSRAALDSPWVADEWKTVAKRGNPLVLAICESVDLPEELHGFPTYDLRKDFKKKIKAMTAYLKGEAEPRHDKVPRRSALGDFFSTPSLVFLIGLALLSPLLLWVGVFAFSPGMGSFSTFLSLIPSFIAMGVGLRHGLPFFRKRQFYKRVRRSLVIVNVWLILQVLVFTLFHFIGGIGNAVSSIQMGAAMSDSTIIGEDVFASLLLLTILLILFIFFVYFRMGRSAKLLRWMRPEEDLQSLRRHAHQHLIKKELGAIGTDTEDGSSSVPYALHHDPADRPLARWMTRVLSKEGHQQVEPSENPQYHLAILSNRSSLAEVQQLTSSYAGKLIFLVASTIDFSDDLKEVGRYQWVDMRNVDKRDIAGLASSMGTTIAGKAAGLEATPSKIDSWHTPAGLRLLRSTLVILSIYYCFHVIANTFDWFFGSSSAGGTASYLFILAFYALVGFSNLWLVVKGLLQRKLPALVMYGGVLLNFLVIYLMMPYGENPTMFPIAFFLLLFLLGISVIKGRIWFPSFAKHHPDEVGVSEALVGTYRKRYIRIIAAIFILYGGLLAMAALNGS